jgi:hypothetical protein
MWLVPTTSLCLAPGSDLGTLLVAGVLGGIASGLAIRWIGRFSGNDPRYEVVYQTGVSTEHYAEAWRDRRRRMVVFKTVQLSLLPMIPVLWYLSSMYPTRQLPILAFPAWFIAYMAAGLWLNRFRCPRCGKLYYWRAQLKGSVQRQTRWRDCRYCGLQQDQLPGV